MIYLVVIVKAFINSWVKAMRSELSKEFNFLAPQVNK